MPNLEPVVLEGRGYELRQIGPQGVIWPNPSVALPSFALLNLPALVARTLPMTNNPNSVDMVSGAWTERLNDAGEGTLTFPNREASDGVPWRDRFDGSGRRQWMEIWNEGYLDFVGYIEKVDLKRDQITVSLRGPWYALKGAYERDWIVVQAPRDVIERGTQVWRSVCVDNFPANSPIVGSTLTTPTNIYTVTQAGSATVTIGADNGLDLKVAPGGTSLASIFPSGVSVSATGAWKATTSIQKAYGLGSASQNYFYLSVAESSSDQYQLVLSHGIASLYFFPGGIGPISIDSSVLPDSSSYSLLLESDGQWIWAYVNGLLLGGALRTSTSATALTASVGLQSLGSTGSVTVTNLMAEALQPFLQCGSDKGDYVLPGDATTYPSGGLHARYCNNLDLQSDSQRLQKIHHPSRSQIYASTGVSEYANQQDATIDGQQNPLPGAATSSWSCTWYGAIYLKLSAGTYQFQLVSPGAVTSGWAARVWIGKTQFGQQIGDSWDFSGGINAINMAVSPGSLAGTLSYGGGTAVRDGWYPIKVEYAVDSTALAAPQLKFQPPSSYTDPGGTGLTGGALVVIPASSLTPLGCLDQRYQGISHFDLVQQAAQSAGYQASAEPYPLETLGVGGPGCFPAQLAPRLREGQDYDVILEPDDSARADGLLNYGNSLDASDIVTSLQGNGAGFQSGTTGQLQALVYDPVSLDTALFDVQGWQDYSDASFAPLLQGLLNALLGLRLTPWQVVSGDPRGSPRLAQTWPLTSTLAQMRWRPGDGLRVYARDIAVRDTTPRQLLLVTRQIHPNAATGTQVGFAARPRGEQYRLKQILHQATRWQRNYQRQLVSLNSAFAQQSLAPGATMSLTMQLSPGDLIVRTRLMVTANTGAVSFNLLINAVDQTAILKGPWTVVPLNLPLDSVAALDANYTFTAAIKNNSGVTTSTFNAQLFLDVLR